VSFLKPATTLTTIIAADMGGAMDGGEYSAALWTMALILFIISFMLYLSDSPSGYHAERRCKPDGKANRIREQITAYANAGCSCAAGSFFAARPPGHRRQTGA
jgi:hypothetical protein